MLEVVVASEAVRRPELRLTIDTPEDLQLIREIYERLYQPGGIVSLRDAIKLLDAHPRAARDQPAHRAEDDLAVVIVADAAPAVGMGHVSRCSALAAALNAPVRCLAFEAERRSSATACAGRRGRASWTSSKTTSP